MTRTRLATPLTQYGIVLLTVVLVVSPLLPILYQSFIAQPLYRDDLDFTLSNYARLFVSRAFYDILWVTFLFSAGIAVVSTAMGALMAVLTVRTDMPGRGWIGTIFTIPIYTSSLVLAFAWITVYGPGGYLTATWANVLGLPAWDLYGLWGMILIGSTAYAAIPYFYCTSALTMADPSHEQAAQICGAGRMRTLWRITLPLLRPALSYSLLINFVAGIETLSIPLILGEPRGVRTFSTFLYTEIGKTEPQYGLVACASMLVLVFMALLIMLQRRVLGDARRFVTVQGKAQAPKRLRLGPLRWPLATLCWIWVTVLVVLPLAGLLARSAVQVLTPYISPLTVLTWDNYVQIFEVDTYARSIWNSLLIAGVGGFFAACLSLGIVLVAERSDNPLRRPLRFLSLFPQAVPGVIVGVGLLWAFVLVPGLDIFRSTVIGLMIAFTMRYIPLAVGAIAPSLGAIGPELDRAARTSGATWIGTVRRILVPLVAPGFLGAYILLFLSFLREYTSAVFLYVPGTEVIGTTLLSLWVQGKSGPVAALAVIQIVLVTAVVLISRRLLGVKMYG
ncbi:ABC transporter permease [Roseitranquillus sediminis]|uniref:ABC transporter permease n=1 Tax=Roseitranquillus sediminis TaxID=2809051 RepID=UPI001D0CA665|nr:iron ABC transporter permease [Roseitranquillus sediminis]MBM9593878.1 iron ABC transporter permease [Roseitranquillus sediminis]